MKTADLYKVKIVRNNIINSHEKITPENGKHFTYEEMKNFVEGLVEIVPLPSGKFIIVNEEGKLIGLLKNNMATDEWKKEYPIGKYPLNNDELIAGNALICDGDLLEE